MDVKELKEASSSNTIRVREEIYENQRWYPFEGYRSKLLPTDRPPFSNEDGTEGRDKSSIKLPSSAWVWDTDWMIDKVFDGEVVDEGWTYAVGFSRKYSKRMHKNSCVRRRKWYRVREYVDTNLELVDSYVKFIRNIHHTFNDDKVLERDASSENLVERIEPICRNLGQLRSALPSEKYIRDEVQNAVLSGANEVFDSVLKSNTKEENMSELEALIILGRKLIADLKKGLEFVDIPLHKALELDFFAITYRVYDSRYGELIESYFEYMNRRDFRRLSVEIVKEGESECIKENFFTRQSLFQLYLILKQFGRLASNLATVKDLKITNGLHAWIHPFVSTWLDVACYEVTKMIPNSVEKDADHPDLVECENVEFKISSSALDICCIFQQIYVSNFWKHLCWPEVDEEFSFVCKILEDLRSCFELYAKLLCSKYEDEMKESTKGKKDLAELKIDNFGKLSRVVSNLQYLVHQIKSTFKAFRIDKLLNALGEKNGLKTSEQCRQTVNILMDSAADYLHNQISHTLNEIGNQAQPALSFLVPEIVKDNNTDKMESKLMDFTEKTLYLLNRQLPPEQFLKARTIIWEITEKTLITLIHSSIEKQERTEMFQRIQNHLDMLQEQFFPPDEVDVYKPKNENSIPRDEILNLLQLHATSTADHIFQYTRERYDYQLEVKKKETNNLITEDVNGFITLRTAFSTDTQELLIEILNCRRLKMHRQPDGKCDPYVKVFIRTKGMSTPKPGKIGTKVKKDTTYPLFDELFSIAITSDEMSVGGMIILSVFNDDHLVRRDELLGEAFIPLESIHSSSSNESKKLNTLPQQHFPLTLPNPTENVRILETLKNRLWDRAAVKFVKEEMLKPN